MAGIKYHYECDVCGGEMKDQGSPPESLHLEEGHFQSCPQCARSQRRRLELVKQQEDEMAQSPQQLKAASNRLAQIAEAKAKRIAAEAAGETEDPGEEEYAEDGEEYYEPEPPARKRPLTRRRVAAAPAPRRSPVMEAMDRLDAAMEAYEAAELELLEAETEWLEISEAMEERRQRLLERYKQPEPPAKRNATTRRVPAPANKTRRR